MIRRLACNENLVRVCRFGIAVGVFFGFGLVANGQELTAIDQLSNLSGGLGIPALSVTTDADGSQNYSVTIQILAIMTALTLLPALLMMMTSFTRVIVVFAILRQAMGLQQTPSNQVLR
jgi:flagellar biosynthesis protein FliP